MRRPSALLVLMLFAGCATRSPASTSPAAAATPECLADAIPASLTVDPEWDDRYRECVHDPAPCERLCDAEDAEACYSLAVGEEERSNRTSAQALYARACVLGHAVACTNYGAGLGSRRHGDPSPEALACAARVFSRTCEAGDDQWGCGMLGAALARGDGVTRDPARAENVLVRSCNRHPYFSCHVLAIGYEEGWFGEVSSERAEEAYARACEGGYTDACSAD